MQKEFTTEETFTQKFLVEPTNSPYINVNNISKYKHNLKSNIYIPFGNSKK